MHEFLVQILQDILRVGQRLDLLHLSQDISLHLIGEVCAGFAVEQRRGDPVGIASVTEQVNEGEREFALIEVFAETFL